MEIGRGSGVVHHISQERVDVLNARKSLIIDAELSDYSANKNKNLSVNTEWYVSAQGANKKAYGTIPKVS